MLYYQMEHLNRPDTSKQIFPKFSGNVLRNFDGFFRISENMLIFVATLSKSLNFANSGGFKGSSSFVIVYRAGTVVG